MLIKANPTLSNPGGGESESLTVFHNTEITGVTDYTMTVDMYLGLYPGSADDATEHGTIGVAGDGVSANHPYNPFTSGSGNYIFMSGDGQDSSDYRHFRDDANGSGNPGPVNQFDPDYLSTDNGTNIGGTNFPFFAEIANTSAPVPGSPGDMWVTVKVEVLQSEGLLKYYVKGGTDALSGDPSQPAEFVQLVESPLFDTDGFVSFGLGDLYSSVAADPDNQFALFDNLFVEGSNPISSGPDPDFNGDMVLDCADIDALVADIAAENNTALFDLTQDGNVNLDDRDEWLALAGAANLASGNAYLLGDADLDGNVNGSDFLVWNSNKFTATAAWCSGDFDADGNVNGGDFLIWNSNKFTSADVSAVPEPATGLLMLGALLVGFTSRRK